MKKQSLIRVASKEEVEFYEKQLYPLQDEALQWIQDSRFYLSGGTCLSRFYYHHRFSEDLDFFFDGFHNPKEEFEIGFREVINRLSEQGKVELTIDGEFFKRCFLKKNNTDLKLEFIYENYKNIGKRKKEQEVFIDTKENIATNKVTAATDRKTVKDFFDLYFLLRELDFEQVSQWAEYKVVPLNYEGMVMNFSDPRLEGEVLVKKEFPVQDFCTFKEQLIQRMIDYAKKIR